MGFLKRLFGGKSTTSDFQERVDAISANEVAAKDASFEENADWDNTLFDPVPDGPTEAAELMGGGLFGQFSAGFGALKGLQQFVEQLQTGQPLYGRLDQLTRDLDPVSRQSAISTAVSSLTDPVRADLGSRLESGSGVGDLTMTIDEQLAGADGFESLLRRLMPGAAAVDPTTSWGFDDGQEPPRPMAPNAIEAMKDPAIKALAQALIPALVKAKQVQVHG